MAQNDENPPDLSSEASVSQAHEVFAYHGGVDSTTILGQLLSHKNPRRFVRIKLREPHDFGDNTRGNLDPKSMEYLQSVEALTVPSSTICRKLIQLYFEQVYPYVPVLNRLLFMRRVRDGKCSIFLLQCIFTSVTPYMSQELLDAMAYSDRAKAQRAFFSKAQLLYDLGAERSQLCLLQGSLILTSTYFSFGLDKDCRFWLTNAVRIATQMGLHRRQIMDQLDRDTVKLVKRIFWVMYSRDVIMVMAGRLNVRALDDRYCDLPEVTREDWEDESEQDLAQCKLAPVPALEKSYLVHSVRLSRISGQYIDTFRRPNAPATEAACEDIETKLAYWRRSLLPELQPETVEQWSQENAWILVLRAMRYRLECLLYRDMRELPSLEQDVKARALQKQQNAMLELDSVFHRIMLHDLVGFCPFSMTTCASTVIAMHIECALSPGSTDTQRQLSRTSIHAGLAYLRGCLQYWDSVRWSLRLLDAMVSRSRLSLTYPEHQPTSLPSMPSRPPETSTALNGTAQPGCSNGTAPEATDSMFVLPENDLTRNSLLRYPTTAVMEHGFSYDSICLDTDLEGDFDDIFLEDFYGANPMQAWAYGGI